METLQQNYGWDEYSLVILSSCLCPLQGEGKIPKMETNEEHKQIPNFSKIIRSFAKRQIWRTT